MNKQQFNSPERLAELEAKAREVIELITSRFKAENIHANVVRIGHWVYVDGESIRASDEIRQKLKTGSYGVKFRYSPKRHAFAWAPYSWKGKSSGASTEQLAEKYGYEGIKV